MAGVRPQIILDTGTGLDPGYPGLLDRINESGSGAGVALGSTGHDCRTAAQKFAGLLFQIVGECLEEASSGAQFQFGEFLCLVACVFGVDQFREQELLEFGAVVEDGWIREGWSEERNISSGRHAHFVSVNDGHCN